MRIAIIGDRGIPARYSGFSTLVEQLAKRLVAEYGFAVTVYCRNHYYQDRSPTYLGVKRVFLPAPGGKSFESIIHSTLSILHAMFCRYDVAFVLDPGNAPLSLPLKLRRFPIVFHTDGLGWQRRKWSALQRKYYKWSERVSATIGDWLVTDARAMQQYYLKEYRAPSSFIPYSGDVGDPRSEEPLKKYGLRPRGYYLCVARLEPENNVDLIIREYLKTDCARPLVVVGGSPYKTEYSQKILSQSDPRLRILGAVYESDALSSLYQNCFCYLHGHEVGGTNPSLLRAMQAGAPCAAVDVVFTREVLGECGMFFQKAPGHLAALLMDVEGKADALRELGAQAQERATSLYRWDAIASAFATLFTTLAEAKRRGRKPSEALSSDIYFPLDFASPRRRSFAAPESATEDTRPS